jgi:hypothetical protein
VKKTQGNSGGPRAGSESQEFFAIFVQFYQICGGDEQTSLIFGNLPHTRKNYLTFLAFALKMAQGLCNIIVVLLLAQEDLANLN